eukprot:10673283-Lingulodinium_polyedra.AAC.1
MGDTNGMNDKLRECFILCQAARCVKQHPSSTQAVSKQRLSNSEAIPKQHPSSTRAAPEHHPSTTQ